MTKGTQRTSTGAWSASLEQRDGRLAGPWDALMFVAGPQRMTPRADDAGIEARPGTKLAGLLAELATCGSARTLSLAVRADLTPRQV